MDFASVAKQHRTRGQNATIIAVSHQLFRPHVVQDPLGVLTVMTAFHDGEQQLRCIVLGGEVGEKKNLSFFVRVKQAETLSAASLP